jgi:branched-chain amino acid transport system permease protein
MRVLGYRTHWYRWLAFCIAATFGGLAGVLGAYYNMFVGPSSLSWTLSGQMLLTVLIVLIPWAYLEFGGKKRG